MRTKIVEAITNADGPMGNWGKFLVGQFDAAEVGTVSSVAPEHGSVLHQRGWWSPKEYFLMLDLETGEGAVFATWGDAHADLDKHHIWVCPLFEPTLVRLREMVPFDVADLPSRLELTLEEAPFEMAGYRRSGDRP